MVQTLEEGMKNQSKRIKNPCENQTVRCRLSNSE